MQTFNIWNLFHLLGRKIIILTLFFSCLTSFGQSDKIYTPLNAEGYDDDRIHFGYSLSFPVTWFRHSFSAPYVSYTQEAVNMGQANGLDTTYSVTSPARVGFSMSLITSYSISERIELRCTPTISLYERTATFGFPNSEKSLGRESNWFEFPILIKYKSQRRYNTRLYFVGGLGFAFETNIRKKNSTANSLQTQSSDFTLEYGIGMENFFRFFKFGTELRFSTGITNLFDPQNVNNPPYTQGIKSLYSQTVRLIFLFE